MNILERAFQLCKKERSQPKQKIYWDVDDVVLNTTETMIELINQKYRLPLGLKPRTREEVKDWGFKSIFAPMTKEQKIELFESNEFWNMVSIKPEFYNIVKSGVLNNYDNVFVTKGSIYNLIKKKEFLYDEVDIKDVLKNFSYIGISEGEDKAVIDMTNGIQIDDNYSNLKNTKAKIKILIKNYVESTFNNSYGTIDAPDNLYNVNSLNEVLDILKFNLVENL